MIHKLLQGYSLQSWGAFRDRGQAWDSPLGVLLFVLGHLHPYLHLRKSPNCLPASVTSSSETQQIKLIKSLTKRKRANESPDSQRLLKINAEWVLNLSSANQFFSLCLSCSIIHSQSTFKCFFAHLLICLTDLPHQRPSRFPLLIRKAHTNWRPFSLSLFYSGAGGLPGPCYHLPTSMVTSFETCSSAVLVSCNQDDSSSNFLSEMSSSNFKKY